MRLLQGREGTGQLSITDRMDVQLSVEETYAGALLLKAWQCLARAIVTEGEDTQRILQCADVAPVRKAGVSAAVSIMRGCNNM